jgi:hypothetical protein
MSKTKIPVQGTLPLNVLEAFESAVSATSWDNWENEEYHSEKSRYWSICEVLHCKLEHIREEFKEEEKGEHWDTIDQIQEILYALEKHINF